MLCKKIAVILLSAYVLTSPNCQRGDFIIEDLYLVAIYRKSFTQSLRMKQILSNGKNGEDVLRKMRSFNAFRVLLFKMTSIIK